MGTDFRRVSSDTDLSIMGQSYGIEGKQVDGKGCLKVHEATLEAVKKALSRKNRIFWRSRPIAIKVIR
jgi:TPP-dependent pyruvate/acetoin dehydrogenase alpha subunit